MAKALPGPLSSQVSGSIGGITFATGPGPQTVRRRAATPNRQSSAQLGARRNLHRAQRIWYLITESQRLAWRAFAGGLVLVDRLGKPRSPSGREASIIFHTVLLSAGGTPSGAAPTLTPVKQAATVAVTATAPDTLQTVIADSGTIGAQRIALYLTLRVPTTGSVIPRRMKLLGGQSNTGSTLQWQPYLQAAGISLQAGTKIAVHVRGVHAARWHAPLTHSTATVA